MSALTRLLCQSPCFTYCLDHYRGRLDPLGASLSSLHVKSSFFEIPCDVLYPSRVDHSLLEIRATQKNFPLGEDLSCETAVICLCVSLNSWTERSSIIYFSKCIVSYGAWGVESAPNEWAQTCCQFIKKITLLSITDYSIQDMLSVYKMT